MAILMGYKPVPGSPDSVLHGNPGGLVARTHPHLPVNRAQMRMYSMKAKSDLICYFSICQTLHQQLQYLLLPLCEPKRISFNYLLRDWRTNWLTHCEVTGRL